MDLIYIILSVILRLSPAVLNLSSLPRSDSRRLNGDVQLAMWLPLVGWVSVLVRHMPMARWLTWRVYQVRMISRASLESDQDPRWKNNLNSRGRPKPSPTDTPD